MRCRHVWMLALLGACAASPAYAQDPVDQVGFAIQRVREVENDWLIARVGITREGDDPAALASEASEAIAWGIEVAKGESQVDVRTGSPRTFPISDPKRGTIRRWRATQELVLEGGDSEVLSRLLGRLQERLQLQGIQQTLSRALRERVQDELLLEVIDAYRARAERIAEYMGARGFQLLELRFDGAAPPRPVAMHAVRAMSLELDAAPPPIEPGPTTVTFGASATIRLER